MVDAALGLQNLGHSVDVYTSHHDPTRCFEETADGVSSLCSYLKFSNEIIQGTLRVHAVHPPIPRTIAGKFHILLAHLRQLHLTAYLLFKDAQNYDVFFVDQLSTCVPLLRHIARKPVVFYVHFPDKLLSEGAYVEGKKSGSLLKRLYRLPMDLLEETTTGKSITGSLFAIPLTICS